MAEEAEEKRFVIAGEHQHDAIAKGYTPHTAAEHLAVNDEMIEVIREAERKKGLNSTAIYRRWNTPKKPARGTGP